MSTTTKNKIPIRNSHELKPVMLGGDDVSQFERYTYLDESDWLRYKDRLARLNKLSEAEIQHIWFDKDTELLVTSEDFQNLIYKHNAPLCHKFIFRLRRCPENGRGVFFWNQIDSMNRRILVKYFDMPYGEVTDNLLNFLVWFFQDHSDNDFNDMLDKRNRFVDELEKYKRYINYPSLIK